MELIFRSSNLCMRLFLAKHKNDITRMMQMVLIQMKILKKERKSESKREQQGTRKMEEEYGKEIMMEVSRHQYNFWCTNQSYSVCKHKTHRLVSWRDMKPNRKNGRKKQQIYSVKMQNTLSGSNRVKMSLAHVKLRVLDGFPTLTS